MFKILGAVTVIFSSVLFGMKKYNDFFERKKILQELSDGCRHIESQLRCMCAPLCDCFGSGGEFFGKGADLIEGGMLPEEAVKAVAYQTSALNREDLRIIESFAEGLCAEDCAGQLSNLAVFEKRLNKQLENAQTELNVKGKLCVKGSILVAAALVLLLV